MRSVHLFRLARVVCRHVFEVISKFEEKMDYSMNLKLIFIWKNIYCVTYIMASPGLTRGSIQHFMASFEDFLCACRRDEVVGERSCVVPAAFILLFRSVCLPRFTLHYIIHCRVTLRVCRREEIRRKEACAEF